MLVSSQVVTTRHGQQGRAYRLPTKVDIDAARRASEELKRRRAVTPPGLSLVPDEPIPPERPSPNARGLSAVTRMGVRTFGDLFAPRAALTLTTLNRLVQKACEERDDEDAAGLGTAVATCLALAVDRQLDSSPPLQPGRLPGNSIARRVYTPGLVNRLGFLRRMRSLG